MISRKHKFIFIHPPRTGGTSIETALEPYSDNRLQTNYPLYIRGAENPAVVYKDVDIKHERLSYFCKLLGNDIDKYTLMSTTRNPWERLVSSYAWHQLQRQLPMEFSIFVRRVRTSPVPTAPVLYYVDVPHLVPRVHFIKFETLAEDFQKCCRVIGLPDIELPHTNKSESEHYSRYYNKMSRSLADRLFKLDIDFFGYEYEQIYKGPPPPPLTLRRHR